MTAGLHRGQEDLQGWTEKYLVIRALNKGNVNLDQLEMGTKYIMLVKVESKMSSE